MGQDCWLRNWFTLRYTASLSLIFVTHSLIFMCSLDKLGSISHKAGALQATTRSYESHLAVRCWTIESNFSLLLNCTASPDNLVHMCRLSGSNWKPKRENWNTATLNLELVWHHVQAEVPASANILLKVKSLFPSLVGLWNILIEMIFNGVSWKLGRDRAATWVEEPIGFLPADQVALRKLFAPRHLEVGIELECVGLRFHLKQLLVGENLVPHLKVGHLAMCRHHWGGSGLVDAP